MAKETIKVGLIGFGTIGRGVVRLFKDSAEIINHKAGVRVELASVCDLDITTDRGVEVDKSVLTNNADDILENDDIDIVVELIGGYKFALDFVMKAMKKGKHVITANKALISKYWEDIAITADDNNVNIMAEAAVGGGIPILRSIDKGLAVNRFEQIIGILNGTCNYILTKMTKEKREFEDVLKEAQEKGFAEADPALDIEGFDTMHKIVILSTMAFGRRVKEEEVYVEGIKGINYVDIKNAGRMGYVFKLLGIAEKNKDGLNVRVHPALIAKNYLLASVENEFNAVYVKGDAVGPTLFYGKGAGEMPTASAVLSDLIFVARNIVYGKEKNPNANKKHDKIKMVGIGDILSRYYMRFTVEDKAGVLSQISGILGKHNISIESMMQQARHEVDSVPVVIMSYEAKEDNVKNALKEIGALGVVKEKTIYYRVVD